jgi:holin-like protein
MKTVRGMAIILGLLVLGDAVSFFLRLPVPGSVIGMVLMASLLGLKIIRLEWVKGAGGFLTENLAFFFVPVGVGVIAHFDLLRTHGALILGVTVFSTLCVLVLTGLFHARISKNSRARKEKTHE